MKRTTKAGLIAALLPVMASAATLFPRTFYYLDGVRVQDDGITHVVEPSDSVSLKFDSSTNYSFTAMPPAGRKIDVWKLAATDGILNAGTLDSLQSVRDYEGGTIELEWTSKFANFAQLYLAPCFSWINWKLAYKSNNTSIAGDFGATNLVYTNTVTVADVSSLWNQNVTGYDVVGWSLSADGPVQFASGQEIANAGEVLGAVADGDQVYLYAIWQKREMPIALDAQGGSVASNSVTVRVGEKYSLPTPQRQGFDFLGWYTAQTGGSSIESGVTTVTRDDISRLYAHWDLLSYRLVYDWNWSGAGGAAPTAQDYGYTNTVTLASAPVSWGRTGYDFAGWAFSDATSATFAAGQRLEMSGSRLGVESDGQNVMLYGVWQKRAMRIALDSQGGTVGQDAITAYIDEKYELPEPVREGFIFAGWYTLPVGGVMIENGSKATTDDISRLYARWELVDFTLAYDENAAAGSRRIYQRCGWTNTVAISDLPSSWMRRGWDFIGWTREATDSDDDVEPEFSAGQSVAGIGSVLNAVQGGTNTLFAVWERRKMTIALDGQGCEVEPGEIVAYVDGAYELPELVRRDAWFEGWWTEASGGDSITNGQAVVRDDIATLYAHWRLKEIYNVNFEFRDSAGDVTNVAQRVYERDPAETPAVDVCNAWAGHTFLYWIPDDWSCITSHVDFVAVYKTNEYDVVFYANGGQGMMPTQHFIYDEAQNLTSNLFTFGKTEAWTFAGWSLAEDSDTVDYADWQNVVNLTAEDGATVELNAVWIDNLNDYSRHIGSDIVFTCDDPLSWIMTTVVTNGMEVVTNELGEAVTNEWGEVQYKPADPVEFPVIAMDGNYFTDNYNFTDYATLTARVRGKGTLRFSWAANNTDPSSVFEFLVDGVQQYSSGMVTNWTTVVNEIEPAYSGDWTEIAWRVPFIGPDHYFYLTDVTWEPDGMFLVSFEANGGEGDMAPVVFYSGDIGSLPRNRFSRTGYTFAEWMDDASRTFNDRAYSGAWTSDTRLTAQWTANNYFLHFDANGGEGEMPDQRLVYDTEAAISPNDFARTGYTFAGWLWNGVEYADGATVSNLTALADATLDFAAQWTANTYCVKLDPSGGEGDAGDPLPFTYDVPANLPQNPFARTGYLFAGWLFGDGLFAEGQVVTNLTAEQGAEVTLSASWSPIEYTVKFDAGAPDVSGTMQDLALLYDTTTNLPPCAFTRTGYAFAGWTFDGRRFAEGDEIVNLSDAEGGEVAMTAQWTANRYSVSFSANGGEGVMESAVMTYDSSSALPVGTFTRLGYRFAGWATSEDGDVVYSDGQDVANLSADEGGAVSLFAAWEPISYSIAFDANGGEGAMAAVVAAYGEETILPQCEFTRAGHEFRSWMFNGVEYSAGQSVINLSSLDADVVVFVAQWDETQEQEEEPVDPPTPPEPENAAEVFPAGADEIGEFSAAAAAIYNGWLRNPQTGEIAALIMVKTTAVKKNGALAKSTIKVTPFSGRKATYKTTVAPGGNPVDEFGIVYGDVGLTGEFDGYRVEASLDFSKAKAQDKRSLVSEMPLGVWTCAFDDGEGYATFAVTVSRKGKAKVAGFLADGKKFTASAQGILGSGYVFAAPVLNAKKGVGFVIWISRDGAVEVSDCVNPSWSVAGKSKAQNLADGLHSLSFTMPAWRSYLAATDREGVNVTPIAARSLSVVGGKWSGVKQVGKLAVDSSVAPAATYVKIKDGLEPANLAALKMSYTPRTGLAKGSFKLWYVDGGKLRSDKAAIAGAAVGGKFFGTVNVKGRAPFKILSAD